MAVIQPDGSLLSTPFYVRFGKYTNYRSKDRDVVIHVNGEPVGIKMHLGSQGHAYFLEPVGLSLAIPVIDEVGGVMSAEQQEEQEAEAMLAGMMSPMSGYSSADEDGERGGGGRVVGGSHLLPPSALGMPPALQQELQKIARASAEFERRVILTAERGLAPVDATAGPSDGGAAQSGGAGAAGDVPGGSPASSSAATSLVTNRLRRHDRTPSFAMAADGSGAGSSGRGGSGGGGTPVAGLGVPPGLSLPEAFSFGTLSGAGSAPAASSPLRVAAPSPGSFPQQQQQQQGRVASAASAPPTAGPVAAHRDRPPSSSSEPQPVPGTSGGGAERSSAPASIPASPFLTAVSGADRAASASPVQPGSLPYQSSPDSCCGAPPAVLGSSPSGAPPVLGSSPTRSIASASSSEYSAWIRPDTPSPPPPPPSPRPAPQPAPVGAPPPASPVPPAPPSRQSFAAAAVSAAATLVPSDASLAVAMLKGVELAYVGEACLPPGTSAADAQREFDAARVSADEFALRGAELLSSPGLLVRLGGSIYPWSAAAPMVIGGLLYGARWEHLVSEGAPCWGPPPGWQPPGSVGVVGSVSAGGAGAGGGGGGGAGGACASPSRKAAVTSYGWTLWPFGGWRNAPARGDALGGITPEDVAAELLRAASPLTGVDRTASAPLPAPEGSAVGGGGGGGGGGVAGGGGVDSMAARQAAYQRSKTSFGPAAAEPPLGGSASDPMLGELGDDYRPKYRKTLTPTSEQLGALGLRPGRNTISYRIGTVVLSAFIYLLRWDTKLVISDVDGTITKSDVLGHLLPAVGLDWTHVGITQLLSNVAASGYQVMYLSSRSIGQANITRGFLNTIVQGEHRMPFGPVIISPDGILPSLYREMILRRPHEFKIATLQEIRALFPPDCHPFYAGFGNRDTDELSYKAVGVPHGRIFIINPRGELRQVALSVQSSTLSSLRAMDELVGNIFPPLPKLLSGVAARLMRGDSSDIGDADESAGGTRRDSGGHAHAAHAHARPAVQPSEQDAFNDMHFWHDGPSASSAADDLMAKYLGERKPPKLAPASAPRGVPAKPGAASGKASDGKVAGRGSPGGLASLLGKSPPLAAAASPLGTSPPNGGAAPHGLGSGSRMGASASAPASVTAKGGAGGFRGSLPDAMLLGILGSVAASERSAAGSSKLSGGGSRTEDDDEGVFEDAEDEEEEDGEFEDASDKPTDFISIYNPFGSIY
ncbi:hypothetical protein FOA52_014791 [Chlamydomonas sp. UWO 241]|nr:hypothetical protein FOA52_014791 [Chlamydomonas sp. UWO 241]